MKKNQDQNSSDDELRFENEFRKLKIALETGGQFYSGNREGGGELPLQVEKQFLVNIEAFDEALQAAEEVSVFEFLGRPEFKKESDLSEDELKKELERIEELMLQNNLECDVIYSIDNRVFYKFITEELFLKTISNIKLPGFMTHFIYEEFHPNFEEDVLAMCYEVMSRFTENKFNKDYKIISMNCDRDYNELITFRNTFKRLIDVIYEEENLNISGHMATCIFKVEFGGIVSDGAVPVRYRGDAQFKLEYTGEGEFWSFTHIHIPGMRKTD